MSVTKPRPSVEELAEKLQKIASLSPTRYEGLATAIGWIFHEEVLRYAVRAERAHLLEDLHYI